MQEIIQSILSNIAIILFMHLCLDAIVINKKKFTRFLFSTAMISVVSITVILIFYLPISFGGYQFDLRLIPLTLFAYKWGVTNGLAALLLTSLWRLGMGGEGALPGMTFGMILPVFTALFFRRIFSAKGFSSFFLIISTSWLLSDLPIILILPNGLDVFNKIALIRFISFNLTGFLLYVFIRNTEREIELKKKLEYFAERDPLTGLYNIRYFKEKVQAYQRSFPSRYIVMIDIDHFKEINDTYGHISGDYILKTVSTVITSETAKYENIESLIGRYGGEEFILYIASNSNNDLVELVEALRKKVEQMTFYTEDRIPINLTVSIGLSQLTSDANLDKAIGQADQSLYQSKRNGRNQITIFSAR